MANSPTDKQINLIERLVNKLGLPGDAWDQFGMSRSAAQRRATVRDASEIIDWLLALEKLRPGEINGSRIKLPSGRVVKLGERVLATVQENRHLLEDKWTALESDWWRRKKAGEATPFTAAVLALVQTCVVTPAGKTVCGTKI